MYFHYARVAVTYTCVPCSEQSVCSARASVMIYDDVNKKWLPSGTSTGLSKVHIYQHTLNNTFRVVGRKLQDHEVSLDCVCVHNHNDINKQFIGYYCDTVRLQEDQALFKCMGSNPGQGPWIGRLFTCGNYS